MSISQWRVVETARCRRQGYLIPKCIRFLNVSSYPQMETQFCRILCALQGTYANGGTCWKLRFFKSVLMDHTT